MIETFKVEADVANNKLLVQLRGFFMKSELELAFYLARKECDKLVKGFDVIMDLDGMHTNKLLYKSIHSRARGIFKSLGAGRIRTISAIRKTNKIKTTDLDYFAFEGVGLYPN